MDEIGWEFLKVKIGEKRKEKKPQRNVPISFQAKWEMEKEQDTRGHDEVVYFLGGSKRAPVGTELLALQKIAENGGKIDYRNLASQLGYGSHYISVVCRSLGNSDYIDFKASGMCILTDKGREELKRKGLLTELKRKESPTERERGMLEKLVQFMKGDGIFDSSEGEKEWVIGKVRCFINREPTGWDLIVVALEPSNFVLRWGWGDLLDIYLAQLDEQLNLIDYIRISPKELEALPKIKEFLGGKGVE